MRLREDDLVWQVIEGEVVALDLAKSSYFRINGTGTILWEALKEDRTMEDLTEILRKEYDIDEARARIDVNFFVEGLRERDLLLQ